MTRTSLAGALTPLTVDTPATAPPRATGKPAAVALGTVITLDRRCRSHEGTRIRTEYGWGYALTWCTTCERYFSRHVHRCADWARS